MCRYCSGGRPPYVIEQEARERKEAEKAEMLLKQASNILKDLRKIEGRRSFNNSDEIIIETTDKFRKTLKKAERLEKTINNWFLRNYGDPKESTLVTGEILDVDLD